MRVFLSELAPILSFRGIGLSNVTLPTLSNPGDVVSLKNIHGTAGVDEAASTSMLDKPLK